MLKGDQSSVLLPFKYHSTVATKDWATPCRRAAGATHTLLRYALPCCKLESVVGSLPCLQNVNMFGGHHAMRANLKDLL
jgi:hypothetical protein